MMKMSNFRWKVAWLIFIVSFVSYMDRVNLSVATPVIMKEYGFDKIDMGLIQSFFETSMPSSKGKPLESVL